MLKILFEEAILSKNILIFIDLGFHIFFNFEFPIQEFQRYYAHLLKNAEAIRDLKLISVGPYS